MISAEQSAVLLRHFLYWTYFRSTLQEVITQGRELAERANEMSTRTLRDKRPLQTASKVLMSDLTNFRNKVEHIKRWLEDAVNFYNLLKKVKFNRCFLISVWLGLAAVLVFNLGWSYGSGICYNSSEGSRLKLCVQMSRKRFDVFVKIFRVLLVKT